MHTHIGTVISNTFYIRAKDLNCLRDKPRGPFFIALLQIVYFCCCFSNFQPREMDTSRRKFHL